MVSMAERITPLPLTSSRADQIFPTLTSVQIERVATHGRRRAVRSGEVLVEQGDRAIPFFVVISGELEAVRPTCATETLITVVRVGQFTGEINTPVADVASKLLELEERFGAEGKVSHLDGLSVEAEDWHFNVRPSNTEPLLRLNLEARSQADMESKRAEVLAVIRED